LDADQLEQYIQEGNPILLDIVLYEGMAAHLDEEDNLAINKATFFEDLHNMLFSNPQLFDELNGVSLGSILAPVHAIAVGFGSNHQIGSWDEFRVENPVIISNQVQGSLDRENIVSHLELSSQNNIILLKTEWLKEWLRDEENGATEEELRQFLKFSTGVASLPEGKRIEIHYGMGGPYLSSCTCGFKLFLSGRSAYYDWTEEHWDVDKESFIRNLKSAIQVEGTQVL